MSDWLDLMVDEVQRKRREAEEAAAEDQRRKRENDPTPRKTDQSK